MGVAEQAAAAWDAAPFHIKTMAGAYVVPILAALLELAERVEALEGGKPMEKKQ